MSKRPYIVGIAGGSCSGKTSIAKRLADLLPGRAVVLPIDAYYLDQAGVPEEEIDVDVPEALDTALLFNHLRALSRGEAIAMPVYDYATHSRTVQTTPVPAADHVIVEGLFALYWDEVLAVHDTSVFVDVDHDTALARRIARDVRERGRTEASVRERYAARVQPRYERLVSPTRSKADMVVDGRDDPARSAETIFATIGKRR